MSYENLLDSIRFNAVADDFARNWRKRGVTREEKLMRLSALLDAAGTPVMVQQNKRPTKEVIEPTLEVIPHVQKTQDDILNDSLNATADQIKKYLDTAKPGKTFSVPFPPSGQYQIQAIESLIATLKLPCVRGENAGAKRDPHTGDMAMWIDFVRTA